MYGPETSLPPQSSEQSQKIPEQSDQEVIIEIVNEIEESINNSLDLLTLLMAKVKKNHPLD